MGLKKVKKSAVFFGLVLALIAAGMELLFNRVIPQAYGICTICHARDLASWIINHVGSLEMDAPDFALQAIVLTPVGLIFGSFAAAKQNKEFKLLRLSNPFLMIAYGFIVALAGLLIMSCPTRIILRVAFGDTFGMLAAAGLFLGIAAAVLFMKRRL